MGVYIVSWALYQQTQEPEGQQTWAFQTLLKVVLNVHSKQEAIQAVYDDFSTSPQAEAGWEIIGNPCAIAVSQEKFDSWSEYLDPTPANSTQRPDYLQPVDD